MRAADNAGPLVFVDDLSSPELADADRHHLERVLRVRPGSSITIADGHGRWRRAVIDRSVEVVGEIEEDPLPAPPVAIAFALVKGAKPDLIVQKLTELGVDRIVPFAAARSVVRWDPDKAQRSIARLRLVARAAAMQCLLPRLPVIEDPTDTTALASRPGAAMADRDGGAPSLDLPLLLVGPEGGWSEEERQLEAPRVVLGAQVLRAETAAITAGVLLTALRAGVVARNS